MDHAQGQWGRGFGRGWIPLERDIGLPGERAHSAATNHVCGAVNLAPLPHAGGVGGGCSASRAGPVPLHHPADGPPPRCGEELGDDPVLTPKRKLRFLDELSRHGNVRVAAARVGVSRSGLYLARRRDGAFAAGWRAALVLARDHAEAVLAERALEGIKEQVFYQGEVVATRRRYDSRLLLAHLARLDALCAGDAAAREGAERFDTALGRLAGLAEAAAEYRAGDGAELYWPGREAFAESAVDAGMKPARAARERSRAGAEWDAHHHALWQAVDRVRDGGEREEGARDFKSCQAAESRASWTLSSLSSGCASAALAGALAAASAPGRAGLSPPCKAALDSPPGPARASPGENSLVSGGWFASSAAPAWRGDGTVIDPATKDDEEGGEEGG